MSTCRMGCDIFEHYERWQNGRWEAVDLCRDFKGISLSCPASLDRDYELFGILAGIWSIYTITPIAPGRGLPQDVSPDVATRWAAIEDDIDLFGVSWVRLDELLAYDWEHTIESDLSEHPPLKCKHAAARFFQKTLPYLRAQVDDSRHLRMVFWFGH